jgi:hypothetical protein
VFEIESVARNIPLMFSNGMLKVDVIVGKLASGIETGRDDG